LGKIKPISYQLLGWWLNFLQELQSGHTIPTRIVTQPHKTHNSCSLKHDLKDFCSMVETLLASCKIVIYVDQRMSLFHHPIMDLKHNQIIS
jgi:hypothetical protein